MAKKKNKKATTVNNIDTVNIEIDYEKLGEAIVKAQQKASEKYSVSREMMKFIIVPAFWIFAGVCGLVSICLLVIFVSSIGEVFDDSENWFAEALVWLLEFVLLLFSIVLTILLICTAKEIDEEKDRHYIATVFSNTVSFVALIIALVALFQSNGAAEIIPYLEEIKELLIR